MNEGKPGLGFSTPTGLSLGGSSEPLTASPNHNPLGGKVVDSLEKKSPALSRQGNKGKKKVSSLYQQGRRKSLVSWSNPFFGFPCFLAVGM